VKAYAIELLVPGLYRQVTGLIGGHARVLWSRVGNNALEAKFSLPSMDMK
jgi:hypothetical protein